MIAFIFFYDKRCMYNKLMFRLFHHDRTVDAGLWRPAFNVLQLILSVAHASVSGELGTIEWSKGE
jgi:hypothetical protein